MTPEDYINKLPTELLYKVFDYLNFEQQMVAMAVCHRWNKILSNEYYIARRRFCLDTCNLNGDSSLLQKMKQYRAFTIKDSNRDRREFLEPLRKFLFCHEVAEKVEELRLELFWYSLSDLLGDNNVLYLPKLEKISYLSSIWVEEQDLLQCKVVAPNLKTVILEDSKKSGNPLIQILNNQIETLSVRFINKMLLFATIGNLPFTSLTSLTLMAQQGSLLFREADFHASHLQIFGRLTYLRISDEKNVFYLIYRLILREAKNLETLIINGRKMSEEAFNQIDRLKKLQELCLMVDIQKSQSLARLSLPMLKVVTTYAGSIIPLGSVPNLRCISVRNYKHPWEPYRLTEDAVNCGIFIPHLQTLKLIKVVLDSVFIKHICSITGLRTLELVQVRMESKHLRRIFSTLKDLQRIRLEWCYLNEVIATQGDQSNRGSSTTDEDDDDKDNDNNEEEYKTDCVRMLQVQYPDRRITNLQNRVVRNVMRPQTMNQRVMLPQYWRPF
ncbi:uncharacterized protein LOC5577774 [Aedes aegypti]|uniref:F-box domain-containing protein n=1 Tax=Aedes aegypti TaxID=7159 RepID=A0A1S4F4A2_AEDAE|nr:uncharacterized protein LOC5577774 [Aedes aegypti]